MFIRQEGQLRFQRPSWLIYRILIIHIGKKLLMDNFKITKETFCIVNINELYIVREYTIKGDNT